MAFGRENIQESDLNKNTDFENDNIYTIPVPKLTTTSDNPYIPSESAQTDNPFVSFATTQNTNAIPDMDTNNDGRVLPMCEQEIGDEQMLFSEDENANGHQVYKTRFWILALFSYTAFLFVCIWGTFGPILESAEFAFGWSDGYIALLDGWGPIFSIIAMIPFNYVIHKYGLRVGILSILSLMTLGTGLRCITLETTAFTYLASVCAILNGIGGCLTFSLPAMFSATWFPAHERATATAIGSLASQLGGAGMYLSPLLVREEEGLTQEEVKQDIRVVIFIHFGMACFGLLCALVHFPAKPSTPPSVSAMAPRVNLFESAKLLIRNRQVSLVVVTYVFSMSIPLSWVSVMNFSLECLNITQHQSMWIAITACSVSPILAFFVARLTDRFYGHLKISIIGLLFVSSCFFLWLLLITQKVILISSTTQVFIAIVCAISSQYAAVPLLIELAVELAYPCPENVVGALLTLLMDVVDTVFFLLMIIPSECFSWLSFALLASSSLTIIPMMFVKESYQRTQTDGAAPSPN